MPRRVFQPARMPVGQVPAINALTTVAAPASTLIIGALVVSTAGLIDTCGANPALIAGVALQKASSAPGYDAANSPATITGRENKVSTAVANQTTVFSGELTNGSTVAIAPVQADIGVSYGVTAYDGVWTVDKNKTAGDARVVITDIDIENNCVFFKFLAANCQNL